MTDRIHYKYKVIPVSDSSEAVQAAIDEWTSFGYELFQMFPLRVGLLIFRKPREESQCKPSE